MIVYIVCVLIAYIFIKRYLRSLKLEGNGNRYVFITGCDSGFGNMLAKRLDDLGFHVFAGCLTKSSVETLQRTCSERLQALELDVTQDTSIEKCLEEVKRRLPTNKGLWAVVNNAGKLGHFGPTAWHTRKDYEDTLDVNLYGVILVTKAFLPLVLQEKGRIINMSSIVGRFPFLNTDYAVSKVAVEGYSDVLRQELYGTGVTVHILEPGFFLTPLLTSVNRTQIQTRLDSLPPAVKENLPADIEQKMYKGFEKVRSWGSPDLYKVIDAYVHAITAKFPKARYMVGIDVKFRILMNLPTWLSDYVIYRGKQ